MRNRIVWAGVVVVALGAAWMAAGCKKGYGTKPSYVGTGGELSGNLSSTGSQYAHTFTAAGVYDYKCAVHPTCSSLMGSVVVVAPTVALQSSTLSISFNGGSAGGPYGGASCSALSVNADSVHVGEQVTWTNNSPLPHTVTSR